MHYQNNTNYLTKLHNQFSKFGTKICVEVTDDARETQGPCEEIKFKTKIDAKVKVL